jgi:cytosine deaminase
MTFDLILRNANVADAEPGEPARDIGIKDGLIVAMAAELAGDGEEIDARGNLVSPGLIETHIHLDKSRILDRCTASPNRGSDHMKRVAAVKPSFTVEDVYDRARATLEGCLVHGVTHMRTHVEVDPNVGLRSFEALQKLAEDYAWAIDLELCVFAQEGWTGVPEVDDNLVEGLKRGATVIGGAPSYDTDGPGQINRIFELAREFDVDVDIHLDVGPTAEHLDVYQVCELTEKLGWGGRVAVGHGSKYANMPPSQLKELGARLADAGVTVTVLPATDLFTQGRHQDHSVIRGVADANALIDCGVNCCLSTNNVLNPFTPYGDCSLVRIANMYANIVQRGSREELAECFEMLTRRPATLLGRDDYGIAVGNPADLVVWSAPSADETVATIAQPLFGFKRGRRTFTRTLAELHRP